MNVRDLTARHLGPFRRRAWLRAIKNAIKPVLGPREIIRIGCRAQQSKVAIQLCTVGIDDHLAILLCKAQCQSRLAARSRPGNEKYRRFFDRYGHCNADSSRTA